MTELLTKDTYQIDAAHSEIGFRVRHLGLATVKGSFGDVEATIEMDGDDLSTLQASASIKTASINTGTEDRDNHLRSGDFFDVESYPTITFESTGTQNVSGNTAELLGNLTIRNTTRPVVLQVTYMGSATDPWGNEKVGFEATGEINRKDFGLSWNQVLETGGLLVGEEVKFVFDIQAAKQ